MKIFEVLCFVAVIGLSSAYPRSRYYPRTYMIGSSIYANPRYVREGPGYEYIPPGQMTAMVVGDTVATNTFSGPGFNPPPAVLSVPSAPEVGQVDEDQVSEQVTEKQQPISIPEEPETVNETEPQDAQPSQHSAAGEQETLFSLDEATTESVVASTKATPVAPSKAPSVGRKTKTGKAKKPVPVVPVLSAEEEEEEEADLPAAWPFGSAGRGGIPSYNAFFPIFIGGSSPSGRSRTRSSESQEGNYPGSATAIANSFSTGKGGVATSHATSFGDPYAAAALRNSGFFNFRTKASKKHVVLEDEE